MTSAAADPGVVVTTTSGTVVGRRDHDVTSFLGIPYAAAPFGERRFGVPEPVEPWTDPRPALAFGPTSPQLEHAAPGGLPDVPEPIIAGDDVLNLNVWTTDPRPERPRPVLVWIHGGGFFAGCSANPWYDGASFARHGLVVVSLNYRLGAEGFLELAGAPTNRAVRDWIAALTWVRENIERFGGDPDRVTVMGQSAGGVAVGTLLVSPAATGLFSRAIIASGVADPGERSQQQAREVAEWMAARVGRTATRDAFADVSPAALAEAGAVYLTGAEPGTLGLPWGPVLDHDVVTTPLLDGVRAGAGADIPVLVGTTRNEFAWRGAAERPDDPDGLGYGQLHYSDAIFRRPTEAFAAARVAAGAPTFRYEFQWRSQADPHIGAGHSLDIPFFFNTLAAPYVEPYSGPNPPQELATAMHGAFAAFARDGDPGWPEHSDNRAVMVFDTPTRVDHGIEFDPVPAGEEVS